MKINENLIEEIFSKKVKIKNKTDKIKIIYSKTLLISIIQTAL